MQISKDVSRLTLCLEKLIKNTDTLKKRVDNMDKTLGQFALVSATYLKLNERLAETIAQMKSTGRSVETGFHRHFVKGGEAN